MKLMHVIRILPATLLVLETSSVQVQMLTDAAIEHCRLSLIQLLTIGAGISIIRLVFRRN